MYTSGAGNGVGGATAADVNGMEFRIWWSPIMVPMLYRCCRARATAHSSGRSSLARRADPMRLRFETSTAMGSRTLWQHAGYSLERPISRAYWCC
jgi:hypothetical protein